MGALFGVLGVVDGQADYVTDQSQGLIFEAINAVFGYHNADVRAATNVFCRGNTEKQSERWLAPGSGYLTLMGTDPLAPPPAVHRTGEWNCGYPLREYGESISYSRVALAYMTLGELDAHIDTIMERDMAQHRLRMLIALMESTNHVFLDPIHGNVNVMRLANTDGTLYPAIPGAAVDADDQHYHDAAFNVAGILTADATNPCVISRNEIAEHYGGRQSGGENILYIHGADQTQYIIALADYDPVPDFGKIYGADTDLSRKLMNVPGRMHGRSDGCWCTEWAWMPDEYGLAVHLDHPPLKRRVDTARSGLGSGLRLVATDPDHPLESAYFSDRFGYGVYDRLAAFAMEINAGGAVYAPPAAYVE